MNNYVVKILTHEELLSERKRLEALIDNQRNIIRHDFDELKIEFRKEIKPALEAAHFVRKIASPHDRRQTVMSAGASLLLDIVVKKLLSRSNILLQVLLPGIVKNYTMHFITKLTPALSQGKIQKRSGRN
jgi:hypothetical protein